MTVKTSFCMLSKEVTGLLFFPLGMSIIPSLVIQQSYCIPTEFQVLQSPAHELENKIIHVPVELELGLGFQMQFNI